MTSDPTKKLSKKKKLKEEHHLQIYKMCSQRLERYYRDKFDRDEALNDIISLCLGHMKYKQIIKFYDVLKEKGIDNY